MCAWGGAWLWWCRIFQAEGTVYAKTPGGIELGMVEEFKKNYHWGQDTMNKGQSGGSGVQEKTKVGSSKSCNLWYGFYMSLNYN